MKLCSTLADEAVLQLDFGILHEQTMDILNTCQRKLHGNGYVRARTRAVFKNASKNETDNTGSRTGAGMAAGWRFRQRSFQKTGSEPLCYSAAPPTFPDLDFLGYER